MSGLDEEIAKGRSNSVHKSGFSTGLVGPPMTKLYKTDPTLNLILSLGCFLHLCSPRSLKAKTQTL